MHRGEQNHRNRKHYGYLVPKVTLHDFLTTGYRKELCVCVILECVTNSEMIEIC